MPSEWIWFPLRTLSSISSFIFPCTKNYHLCMGPIMVIARGGSELEQECLGLLWHQEAHLWINAPALVLGLLYFVLRVLLKIISGSVLDHINPKTVASLVDHSWWCLKFVNCSVESLFRTNLHSTEKSHSPSLVTIIKAKDIIASDTLSHLSTTPIRLLVPSYI